MFAAATSAASAFFKISAISQNYTLGHQGSSSRTSSPGPSSSPAPKSDAAPFTVGLWRVQEAIHKTTSKRVSVWSFDKRSSVIDKLGQQAKERVMDVLKAEATALGRMRHPCVLEMVEPLEETRSELIFATEPVTSTLSACIPGSPMTSRQSVELDEIEIQKGILQLAKGLAFINTSARLVHSNLNPDSVLINAAGDWKLSGLGLTIPLLGPDGGPARWEFPTYDVRLPACVQRSFDYMAPEYALSEQINTASDMYSMGCVLYAVHAKGAAPFRNHNSLSSMRSNVGRLEGGGGLPKMESWDRDLQNLLSSLITPTPLTRLTSQTMSTHSFFSSIAVSTLNFLDPSTFAPKPREEKIAFMKGLQSVLGKFSEGMRRRKVLPSLLAEMKDPLLLPSILPNVFNISSTLDASQFQQLVLPSLKPLFAIRDPPQNMIVLLENLKELQGKTAKGVFRSEILPLVYNALESEHSAVQERALEAVPDLCETIDYAEVQSVLFPRVALVFTKTRILSVKVSTLTCFLAMVKTLDQASLTQKLVPLLAKIRTKEPAVMVATLSVHEALGRKIDREAIALLVLPQLWQMSMGPLLNVEQFGRFMSVIRVLAERVEREHGQHLRDAQRVEDRSALATNGGTSISGAMLSSGMDFESLVGGGRPKTVAVPPEAGGQSGGGGWEDDVWGSMLGSDSPRITSSPLAPQVITHTMPTAPPLSNNGFQQQQQSHTLPITPRPPRFTSPSPLASTNTLGARKLSTTSSFSPPASATSFHDRPKPYSTSSSTSTTGNPGLLPSPMTSAPSASTTYFKQFATPLQPQSPQQRPQQLNPTKPQANYNISLEPLAPTPPPQNFFSQPMQPSAANANNNGWGGTPLMPTISSAAGRTGTGTGTGGNKASLDWGGFDPLL